MLRRGLAFSLLLAVASAAQAGVIVDLVPATAGPYAQDESVDVDIMLRQDPTDGDHSLRFIQFDFNTTAPELTLIPLTIHRLTNSPNIRFWNFVGVTNCVNSTDAACGSGHFLEDVLNGPRGRILSATYYFTDPLDLGENTTAQRILPGNGDAVKVGVMRVRMPTQDGVFMLDVVNATETNPDVGGVDVRWGFGFDVNGEPLTTWRANTGEITGGTLTFCVGNPPGDPCPDLLVNLVPPAAPPCNTSLTRTQNNVIKLTFEGVIPDPVIAGQVEIRRLLPNGALDPTDLSDQFTFSVVGGNVLRIDETGDVLSNETWYAVLNSGNLLGVAPFKVDYRVVYGDVDDTGLTTGTDANDIWQNRTSPPLDSKYDIDGNGFITGTDANDAWGFRNSTAPLDQKPSEHACSP